MLESCVIELLEQLVHPGERIAIYGAGRIGMTVLPVLEKMGITVEFFLDKNTDRGYKGLEGGRQIPVCSPDEENPAFSSDLSVLLGLYCGKQAAEEIIERLKARGFSRIIYSQELIACYCAYGMNQSGPVELKLQESRIREAMGLMSDEHSREVMARTLRAYGDWNFADVKVSEGMVQYFDVNVPFQKGYGHFVDCGAYVGDSLEEWLRLHGGAAVSYTGFEPDEENFQELVSAAGLAGDRLEEILLMPCAVSARTGITSFCQSGDAGSRLDETTGETAVMAVSMDDVLRHKKVTMIKMDVEGAETDALRGAYHIITGQKPDLAICVYHRISDLWEIPLLLHEWVPEYHFYLRCHEPLARETVLYVTC